MDDDPFKIVHYVNCNWFRNELPVFQSAVRAIQRMLPYENRKGWEITCGAGLFSRALDIPNLSIQSLFPPRFDAKQSHYLQLPFENLGLDFIFISYCEGHILDLSAIYDEVYRALKSNGVLVVAFIDSKSPDGKAYIEDPAEDLAPDAERILLDLTNAGFRNFEFAQTLFAPPDQIKAVQNTKPGYGEGSFVVIQAHKKV
ncbi:MAG: methyltransferase domain-containing protein [Chryseosolibacter sp.]